MSQAVQKQIIQSAIKLLDAAENHQKSKGQLINPRLHARKGAKRAVDFYTACRKNPANGNPEIVISGPGKGINLIHAEVFINQSGVPQVHQVTNLGYPAAQVPTLIFEALNLIVEKGSSDDMDFYNPYLDGFYITKRNPGKQGRINIANAKKANLISANFEQVLIAWKFSMTEYHPNLNYIAAKKKKLHKT